MDNPQSIDIIGKDVSLQINLGKLVSIKKDFFEYMHGAEKPEAEQEVRDTRGWKQSEIAMFPIVGPAMDYRVDVCGESYLQDQHGISRNVDFRLISLKQQTAKLVQYFSPRQRIINPKFSDGIKNPAYLEWPFYCAIEKTIILGKNSVFVNFQVINLSKEHMPFMFGWHPAFRMLGNESNFILDNGQSISLEKMVESTKNGGISFNDSEEIIYSGANERGLRINTKGFGGIMLWSPGYESGMFCIEPVSHIPELKKYFADGKFDTLRPRGVKEYNVEITPF